MLLDTNALIWLASEHPRSKGLLTAEASLYISPISLLELTFLKECGRIHFMNNITRDHIIDDARWMLDDPSLAELIEQAHDVDWTRDPFDRLLVAHAKLRGWTFATSDKKIIEHSDPSNIFVL